MGLGAGQIALDTDLAALTLASSGKPAGRIFASAVQTIPAASAQTALLMGAEDYDTHNFHSTSVNSARIIPTIAGYYRFTGTVFMAGTPDLPANQNQACFRKNGVTNLPPAWRGQASTGSYSMGPVVVTQPMDGVSDYVELTAFAVVSSPTVLSVQFATTIEWEYVRGL